MRPHSTPTLPPPSVLLRRPNWYLRLTSSGWWLHSPSLAEQEWARRSQLASYLLLTVLVPVLTLIPDALDGDRGATGALILVGAGMPLALLLNRLGRTTLAGALIIGLVFGAIMGAIIAATDPVNPAHHGLLALIYLPAFDLFSIAIVMTVAVLPRRGAVWLAVVAAITLTIGDLLLQPAAPDLATYKAAEGIAPLVLRPIALFALVALISWLQARSVDMANRRALQSAVSAAQAEQEAREAAQEADLVAYILDQTREAAGAALVQGAAPYAGASGNAIPWGAAPPHRIPTPAHVHLPFGYAAGRFNQYATVFNHLFQQLRQNKAAAQREAVVLSMVLALTHIVGDARLGRAIPPQDWPQATGYEPVDSLVHAVAMLLAAGPGRPA